jgi:hypothetical protein
MFVGYLDNHSRDFFRMLNLKIYGIINSRDKVWLVKIYDNWISNKSKAMYKNSNEKGVMQADKGRDTTIVKQKSTEIVQDKENSNVKIH